MREEIAMEYFKTGYNCSQAVVLAYKDLLNLDEETLLKLASSFGGGLGRLREVCGCVSGMAIVAGLLYGYSDPKATTPKADHYELIQKLAKAYEEKNGSIVCRELLNLSQKHDSPTPEARTNEYYKKRPCVELVGMAVSILDEMIASKEADKS